METLMSYLKQPSTLRGLIAIIASLGVVLSPELTEAIIATAVGAVGIVEVLRNENKAEDKASNDA